MANNDLKIALRAEADFKAAQAEIKATTGALGELDRAGSAVSTAGVDQLTAASQKAAAATRAQAGAATAATAAAQATAGAVGATVKAHGAAAISAKQHAAALRMLPAQMTDITVGLSTGQSPFMVLMQQGGQLKDMFGGIGPAAKAVGGAVLSMVNPLTVAAAAAAALALAYKQGSDEADGYVKALAMTGNAAGVSAGQISAMARRVGETVGTTGAAAEALTALAATGRVSGASMEQLGASAIRFEKATGQAVSTTVEQIAALGKEPVKASLKLNEQLGYLTLAQRDQIQSLMDQGRASEAAALAQSTYATAMNGVSQQVKDNAGTMQRAWESVAGAAKGAWDAMLDIGRPDDMEQRISKTQARIERLRFDQKVAAKLAADSRVSDADLSATGGNSQSVGREIAQAEAELAGLKAKKTAEEAAARAAQKASDDSKKANAAKTGFDARTQSLRNWRERLAEEIKLIREQGKLAGKEQAEIEEQVRRATERLTPKKVDSTDNAYQQQAVSLTTELAAAQNRLQNAKDGVTASEDRAIVRLEAWLATNQKALKLDAARVAELKNLATGIDAANKAAEVEQKAAEQRKRVVEGLQDIQVQWLEATGRTAEATAAKIESRFAKLRADLQATGKVEGLVKLDKIIDIERARAEFAELQQEVERIFAGQGRAEQSLNTSVTAGLTSELEAKRQVLALNANTAAQVEAMLPRLRELAAITGNPALAAGVADLELRVTSLRTQSNELKNAFGQTFGSSFSDALQSLADGTNNLRDAVRGFISDLATGMAQWASQQLAMQAQASLMSLFNSGTQAAAGAGAGAAGAAGAAVGAAADVAGMAASTAAQTANTSATTAAAAAAALLAPTLTAAGTAATAMATAMAAAATSSAGSSGAGLAGSFASAAASSFATGGYTGAGGKYQPAGIVHAGEFVHRQEVVRQPGALGFLAEFNRIGMRALAGRGMPGYATGGLVMPALPMGRPTEGPAGGASTTTLDNRLSLNLIDDPERIAGVLASPQGDKAFTVMLSRNPQKYRQLLGL